MQMTKRSENPDMTLLFLSGLLRDEMPWMSEVLTETYRELRNSSPQDSQKIKKRLVRFVE